jgi:hypothetical protein
MVSHNNHETVTRQRGSPADRPLCSPGPSARSPEPPKEAAPEPAGRRRIIVPACSQAVRSRRRARSCAAEGRPIGFVRWSDHGRMRHTGSHNTPCIPTTRGNVILSPREPERLKDLWLGPRKGRVCRTAGYRLDPSACGSLRGHRFPRDRPQDDNLRRCTWMWNPVSCQFPGRDVRADAERRSHPGEESPRPAVEPSAEMSIEIFLGWQS